MTRHKLADALVCPTDSPAWVTDIVNGDHFVGGSSTLPAVAGYPHITVPAGFAFELPVGPQLHRPRLERADAVQAGVRLRAGHQGAPATEVPRDGAAERLVRQEVHRESPRRHGRISATETRRARRIFSEPRSQRARDSPRCTGTAGLREHVLRARAHLWPPTR